jgi:hypothetical protein
MNEAPELVAKLKGIGADFDKFREEQEKRFQDVRGQLLELISKKLKESLVDESLDVSGAEQAYCDLIDGQWKMDHKEYGDNIEDNIRTILKNIFGEAVSKSDKKGADILIVKGKRKMAIEVETFVDISENSRQGIKKLAQMKRDAETGKGFEKFIVFAHNACNKEIIDNCLKPDQQWIILLAYCKYFGHASVPIWNKYKGYSPLKKLAGEVNGFLKEKTA